MKRIVVLVLALGLVSSIVGGEAYLGAQGFIEPGSPQERHHYHAQGGLLLGPNTTYLEPIRPNAYGPGIHADATGRPFQWQPVGPTALGTEGMPPSGPDPTLRVTPNKYGLGVHADQYGRIVQPVCLFGEVC